MGVQDKLRFFRKNCGISQMEAAEKLEVSRQTIHRWEAGASVPNTENLMRLSELYDVPLEVWMDDAWTPDALEKPAEPEPEPAVLEPPAQERPASGRRKHLRRSILSAVILSAVLVLGIAIGIWYSHKDDIEVISQKDLEGEVIDLTTLGDPLPLRPPKD